MADQTLQIENSETGYIQKEIEIYTKKIEHEKINARLARERYETQLCLYMQLQGLPVPIKSKEQKEKEKKERKEKKLKRRPLFESNSNLNKMDMMKSNPGLYEKNLNKNETELDKLTTEINHLMLENKNLKKQLEDLRKEKLGASSMLDSIKSQKDSLKIKINTLSNSNKEASNKIRSKEIESVENEAIRSKQEFQSVRDELEEKFHNIIEENIRREREHKKELTKKRLLGSLSSLEDDKNLSMMTEEQHEKLLEDETISDRTPILDILIEKWKFCNKYKKSMLERYIKNAQSVREAFEKMIRYLGLDEFEELPVVLEKMEEQMSSIEMFISQLTNDINHLEDKKKIVELKIHSLNQRFQNQSENKSAFQESKQSRIAKLKQHINELNEDIEKKRNFFSKLQPETDSFLSHLTESYISEFIPKKIAIKSDLKYNESNIEEVIANILDYHKIIEEFEKSSQSAKYDKRKDQIVNKDIEKMKNELKNKLDLFREENRNEICSVIKDETKRNLTNSYDDTIHKIAENLVEKINNGSLHMTSNKKKK